MKMPLPGAFFVLLLATAMASCVARVGQPPDERDPSRGGQDDGAADGQGGTDSQNGGDDVAITTVASATRFSRLTHFQWNNAVRDLLRIEQLPSAGVTLQADAVVGFDNNNSGTALDISFDLRGDYERAAEAIAASVARDGAALERLVPHNAPSDGEGKARATIRALASRAYRRALKAGEEDELLNLFEAGQSLLPNRDAFTAGVELVISALLQSPLFLYRIELGENLNEEEFALTPFEMASRLSFALTDSMPDDELFEAAISGKLETQAQIEQQALRLFQTPAAAASAAHFHEQLFRLASFEKVEKDPKLFPAFSDQLAGFLKQEAALFVADILKADKPAAAILTLAETFVNDELAKIYGLSGNFDGTFRKAKLDRSRRSGLLTQLGFLAANAGSKDPDPIHRGVFISHVMLCQNLPSPAGNVPPVPVAEGKTNRERVDGHTGEGTCGAACHATLINPLGFAFESFDAIGAFRSTDNGSVVDTSGDYAELTSGTFSFRDGVDLSERLAKSTEFHECYLKNWIQYLWGRARLDADDEAVKALATKSLDGTSVRGLLLSLVTSPAFRRYVP